VESAGQGTTRTAGEAVVVGGGVAAAWGLLLWLAWEPTTRECLTIGECLGAPIAAMTLSVLAFLVNLVLLRLLGVRPVLLPTVLCFVGAGALVATLATVLEQRADETTIGPWWVWMVIWCAVGALAVRVHQPGRSWKHRTLTVLAIASLVAAGSTWVIRDETAEKLSDLQAVGVEEVLVPQLPGYEPAYAWPTGEPEAIRVTYHAVDGEAQSARVRAELVPLADRDPCDLASAVEHISHVQCTGDADGLVVRWSFPDGELTRLAGGHVVGSTLVILSAEPGPISPEELLAAVRAAEPATLEDLRDL